MQTDAYKVRLFSGLAVRAAFDNGMIAALREHGIDATIDWDPTTVIEARLRKGDTADAIIVTDSAMKNMVDAGWVAAQHCLPLVASSIGVAVKRGAPRPDISSVPNFFDALLKSRSVAYSLSGASGIYLQQLLRERGHLEEINRRATAIDKGLVAERLVSGEADIAIQQVSELSAVDGIDIVGPLPAEIQQTVSLSVGICSASVDRPVAHDLLKLLTSGYAKTIYERNGLTARW
jgi:molybdate transport system substrate-binding protein